MLVLGIVRLHWASVVSPLKIPPLGRVARRWSLEKTSRGHAAPGWVSGSATHTRLPIAAAPEVPLSKGDAVFIARGAATRHEKLLRKKSESVVRARLPVCCMRIPTAFGRNFEPPDLPAPNSASFRCHLSKTFRLDGN